MDIEKLTVCLNFFKIEDKFPIIYRILTQKSDDFDGIYSFDQFKNLVFADFVSAGKEPTLIQIMNVQTYIKYTS